MPTSEEGEEGGLENIGNNAKLRDLGLEWSDRVVKEFMEKVGKDYKGEERALFYMTFGGDLIARMFGDVKKDIAARHGAAAGDGVAKKLFETALTLTALLLRRHGEDLHARVTVDFTDVANFRNAAEKAGKPEEVRDQNTCTCELDQDGHCAECAATFKEMFSSMGKAIQILQMNEMVKKKFCRPCAPRHMDGSLAQVVREEVSKVPPEGAEAFMNALFMASQNLQAMPMPLTKKAWSELQGKA